VILDSLERGRRRRHFGYGPNRHNISLVYQKNLKFLQQLLDTIWSQPKLSEAVFGLIKIAKKIRKIKKKIIKGTC